MIAAHGNSHTGLVRKINEDSHFCNLDFGIFVVADGMGGHNAGEVASQLAIDSVRTFIERSQGCEDCTWPYGIDPNLSINANRLATAMKLANRRIFKASEAREAYTGMGTTTVAALVEDRTMCFCNVGDSRLYSFRGGQLQQLTRDHSWAAEVLAHDPTITPEALARNPMRHVLTHVIGAREEAPIEVITRSLSDGELILLCSDGLHGPVNDEAIARTLRDDGDLTTMVDALIQQALDGGGRDNVTAVLLQYHE